VAAAGAVVGIIGLALQAVGGAEARKDAKEIAKKKRQAAEFEAIQLEQQANDALATSQRTLFNEKRTEKLVQSRALTLAAASGGASDPTVIRIISGIASEAAYRQNLAIYQGEDRARSLRLAAQANRFSGEIGAAASLAQGNAIATQAAGQVIGGAGSLYARYGYGSPSSPATPINEFTYDGGGAANPSYG
jgi:hypothetical protein